jgi:hypothetical protein
MDARKTLMFIVGILQIIMALLIVVFTCVLYFNFFNFQTWLNAAVEFSYIHFSALLVFGFFSIVSGLLLVQEWVESS